MANRVPAGRYSVSSLGPVEWAEVSGLLRRASDRRRRCLPILPAAADLFRVVIEFPLPVPNPEKLLPVDFEIRYC